MFINSLLIGTRENFIRKFANRLNSNVHAPKTCFWLSLVIITFENFGERKSGNEVWTAVRGDCEAK